MILTIILVPIAQYSIINEVWIERTDTEYTKCVTGYNQYLSTLDESEINRETYQEYARVHDECVRTYAG